MSIDEVQSTRNPMQLIERTLWTSVVFVAANTLAFGLFSGQSLSSRLAFPLIQGGLFPVIFENHTFERWNKKLKESWNLPVAHKILDYALFFFLLSAPIISARIVTTYFFKPLSFREAFKIGTVNYLFGVAGIIGMK